MNKGNDIDRFLNKMGYGFPDTSDEISEFNVIYSHYRYKANVENVDPERILSSINLGPSKVDAIAYHKRTVLAAEIVYQLKDEWSMGHLKLQKLLYLCQNAMKMPIHANFLKQAMGPYDPKLKRSLDKQFEEHKWFKFQKYNFPKYLPLENCGQHKDWFQKYFSSNSEQVTFIIDTFRSMKTHEVELIATIFACWNNLNTSKKGFSVENLITEIYDWSAEKQKFTEKEILKSLEWMKEKGITPIE